MGDLFTTSAEPWGREAPSDLAASIRTLGLEVRPSHAFPPGTMLLVSPPDFRSLFSLPPPGFDEPPFGLTEFRVRFSRPELLRVGQMVAYAHGRSVREALFSGKGAE